MIIVDPLCHNGWSKGMSCHLIETENDMEALDQFAENIGCKKEWRHEDHYDLTSSMRAKAVKAGAVEVDRRTPEYRVWMKKRRTRHVKGKDRA